MKKKLLLTVTVSVLSLALMIAGWILLPDQVGMQINTSGQLDNVVPKPVALLLPFAISAAGVVMLFFPNKKVHPLFLCGLGILLQILTIGINLFF